MKKYIVSITALLCAVSCLFAETDPIAMKAIKHMRYGTSDKYNLVSPVIEGTSKTDTISENTAGAGVTIDGVKLKDSIPYCDTIAEKTAAAGVTVDGVKLKDSIPYCDTIAEKTSAAGVTVDGVKLKDSIPYCDTISEKTSDAGVTIDSLKIKDGEAYLDTIRNPASSVASLWYTAPIFADPSRFGQFYDEFHAAGYVADAATTNTSGKTVPGGYKFAETSGHGAWLVTVADTDSDEAEVIQCSSGVAGGILQIRTNNGTNDTVNVQLNGESFACDSTRDLWYETRLEVTDVSEDILVWGLGTTDGAIITGYPDDYMFFRLSEGTNVSFITCKNSTSVTNANITTLADAQGNGTNMKRFGIFVDGSTTSQYVYVNGTAVATNAASASIPDDEELSPAFELRCTDASTDSVWIDYLKIINTK